MTPEVSCELASRWLSRAIDEELSPEEERLLERHLDACPHCRTRREVLFTEAQLVERDLESVSAELDELLEGRLGAAQISEAERAVPVVGARSGLRRGALLSAAVLLALVGLFVTRDRSLPVARTVSIEWGENGVEWTTGGRRRMLAGSGQGRLAVGDRIRLPAGSEAWFEFADGSYARIGARSVVGVLSLGSTTEIELLRGRAAFDVAPQHSGGDDGPPGRTREGRFRVLTSQAVATVVGTRFGVIHEDGATEVSVEEGEVRVERRYVEDPPSFRIGPEGWIRVTRRGLFYDSAGQYTVTDQVPPEDADPTRPSVGGAGGAPDDDGGATPGPGTPDDDGAGGVGGEDGAGNGAPLDVPPKRTGDDPDGEGDGRG